MNGILEPAKGNSASAPPPETVVARAVSLLLATAWVVGLVAVGAWLGVLMAVAVGAAGTVLAFVLCRLPELSS